VNAQHRRPKSQAQLPSLQGSNLTASAGPLPTLAVALATSTGGSTSHNLRFLPLQSLWQAPSLRGRAATWRKLPRAAQDVQEQRGGRIRLVRRSGHDEIFPGVGSGLPKRPITWIMSNGKGHTNPLPARHRTARPVPAGIRGKVESCTKSSDLTVPAWSWVGRSHLGTGAAATSSYRGYHD
jgi:hypothetical protein